MWIGLGWFGLVLGWLGLVCAGLCCFGLVLGWCLSGGGLVFGAGFGLVLAGLGLCLVLVWLAWAGLGLFWPGSGLVVGRRCVCLGWLCAGVVLLGWFGLVLC